MILSVQQIKYELLAYIKEFGGDFSQWYVSVASDPKATLTSIHRVDTDAGLWIYKQALTARAACTAQAYFVDLLGTDGKRSDAPTEDCDCVYAYRKDLGTEPGWAEGRSAPDRPAGEAAGSQA